MLRLGWSRCPAAPTHAADIYCPLRSKDFFPYPYSPSFLSSVYLALLSAP
nr:MAG TPA: hypothetical protein [Caudoviricetes sp.]